MWVFLAEMLLLGASLLVSIGYFFLIPPKYPQNIPAIPFWVALIPFFKDVDQSDIFRKYIDKPLRTHGAVKLFFGAQWNILVHRPSYVTEIFRNEDIYQKSGNQKKIPHSVLAYFLGRHMIQPRLSLASALINLGDNIISAHGDTWKTYQRVIKPGLQRNFEADVIAKNAASLCRLLRDSQKRVALGGVAVQDLLQRYSVANCSEALLQTNLGVGPTVANGCMGKLLTTANCLGTRLARCSHQPPSDGGEERNLQACFFEFSSPRPSETALAIS